ncbi:MAG: hypothetical protein LBT59_28920 [Clostridiales bacterium]|jgi:hypothetical protein|nr:hypothetical protein [Clostridiales bacterium]
MLVEKLFHANVPKDPDVLSVTDSDGQTRVYKIVEDLGGNGSKEHVLLGILDPDSEMGLMWPSTFYQHFYDPKDLYDAVPWVEYGLTYVADKICHDIGLFHALESVFGEAANLIVAVATFSMQKGVGKMSLIDDWAKRSFVPDVASDITKESVDDLFYEIMKVDVNRFFESWMKVNNSPSTGFCFDIPMLDHDNSEPDDQHVMMFCHEKSKVPLFYRVYRNTRNRSDIMVRMNRKANSLGMKKRSQIIDDGDRWLCPQKNGFGFRLPGGMEPVPKLVHELLNKGEYEMFPSGAWQYASFDTEYIGSSGKLSLVLPKKLGPSNSCASLASITEEFLKELKCNTLGKSKKATTASIARAIRIIDKQEHIGYFTTEDWTTLETLERYNAKDVITNEFPRLFMPGDSFYPDGQYFIAFIASIISTHMNSKLLSSDICPYNALHELSHIIIVSSDGKKFYMRFNLNKDQKKLLDMFGVKIDKFFRIKEPLRTYWWPEDY